MEPTTNPEKEAQAAVEEVIPQQKKPGRKALQIFAVIVLLLLVAGGVYAWQNNRVAKLENQVTDLKKEETAKPKEAPVADPYAGWKTYTTKYEKLTFKYPANYTLKVKSEPSPEMVTPGTDIVTITSPSGYVTSLSLGLSGIGGACPDAKVVQADPIDLIGKKMYINYIDQGDGKVGYQLLAERPQDACFGGYDSKNVVDTSPSKSAAANLISARSDQVTASTVALYKQNADVVNATLIIKSLSY